MTSLRVMARLLLGLSTALAVLWCSLLGSRWPLTRPPESGILAALCLAQLLALLVVGREIVAESRPGPAGSAWWAAALGGLLLIGFLLDLFTPVLGAPVLLVATLSAAAGGYFRATREKLQSRQGVAPGTKTAPEARSGSPAP